MKLEDRAKAADDCRRVALSVATLSLEGHKGVFGQFSHLPEDEQAGISNYVNSVLEHHEAHVSTKVADKFAGHGWDTPIASKALHSYMELREKQQSFSTSPPLYDQQLRRSNLELAHTILRATLDGKSILHISTFCRRLGLCEIEDGAATFRTGLKAYEVINLMYKGVYAVSVSYKHTRVSVAGLSKDESRVHRAIEHTAKELSQERLLFWCDVIGRTPPGISWAQAQGLDPYLFMPTLRVVSAALQWQIEDSFWMTAERIAASFRGGMLTYDEDLKRLRIEPRDGTVTYPSKLWLPFEIAKLYLAKVICNPVLYYRNARCEEDKLELMKYGIACALSAELVIVPLLQNEYGVLKVRSWKELTVFGELVSVGCSSMDFKTELSISRPNREIFIKPGERWHGLEEIMPGFLLVDKADQETSNFIAERRSDSSFNVKRLSSSESITELVCCVWGCYNACAALRLRVAGFVDHEDRVTGRVVSFRVATKEEESLLMQEKVTPKTFCFD